MLRKGDGMSQMNEGKVVVWKETIMVWGSLAIVAILLLSIFFSGLSQMVSVWEREEYSHGFLLPFIALFLIWQKKDQLERLPFKGSWAGLLIVAGGILLYLMGELSTLYILVQYAFLIVLVGLAIAFMGWKAFKITWVPFLILVFMIPLPTFLFNALSAQLQLISSQLGVAVIRLFDISVFLEGNVIDLGVFKLQVVEACSGLRYLFPLMTLGFIAAYFFKGAFWKRAIIFLSTVPITVLMNSFRIGVIGVTVNNWGPAMAEGFLHDFEGWVVFMGCTGVLIIEMWLLAKIGKDKLPLREAFGLDFPAPSPKNAQVQYRTVPQPFIAAALIVAAVAALSAFLPERVEVPPQRTDFSNFPLKFGEWQGKGDRLDQIYIDALKFDDYIITDYVDQNQRRVNFYVAYYASQRKGESAHSPRTCIPGGGWEITSHTQRNIEGVSVAGHPLQVNRLVIEMGETKQLVYYWFQQRGRVITNEYLVKWYLFWDALTRNRTDGSLVRLTTSLQPGEDLAQADVQLSAFAKAVNPELKKYIPE